MGTVGVVVPFYQTQKGLLGRALASVFAQSGVDRVEAVVVDDGSPVPAEDEWKALSASDRGRTHLIRTTNSGPAAARNKGLAFLAGSKDYIAFLDSDDSWYAHHLSTALEALERAGAPDGSTHVYFCNRWIGEDRCTADVWRLDRYDPPRAPLPGMAEVAFIDRGFARFMMSSMLHTSGLVCRLGGQSKLRFNETIRRAEDYLFFTNVVVESNGLLFNMRPGFEVGRGVSISRSKWGTLENLEANLHLRRSLRRMRDVLGKNGGSEIFATELAYIKEFIRQHEKDTAIELVHHLARVKPDAFRHLLGTPALALQLPPAAFQMLARKTGLAKARHSPS